MVMVVWLFQGAHQMLLVWEAPASWDPLLVERSLVVVMVPEIEGVPVVVGSPESESHLA